MSQLHQDFPSGLVPGFKRGEIRKTNRYVFAELSSSPKDIQKRRTVHSWLQQYRRIRPHNLDDRLLQWIAFARFGDSVHFGRSESEFFHIPLVHCISLGIPSCQCP